MQTRKREVFARRLWPLDANSEKFENAKSDAALAEYRIALKVSMWPRAGLSLKGEDSVDSKIAFVVIRRR